MIRGKPLLYSKYARYYDIIYREYQEKTVPAQINFLKEIFEEHSERKVEQILDVACGTGSIPIKLASMGYKVTGVDISREMIEIARKKAESKNVAVKFEVKDMRNLDYKDKFDAATCIFTSISYNTSMEDMIKTFSGIYRALKAGGLFIVDNPNPYRVFRSSQRLPHIWSASDGNVKIIILDEVKVNPVSAMARWERDLIIYDGSKVKVEVDLHHLKFYTAEELKLYAKLAGFRKMKIYGDMKEENPEDARRIYLIAVK